MKKLVLSLLLLVSAANAQVGIGTETPNDAAVLDVTSTNKGFLPPRLTTTQRNAITNPVAGLVIYNTTTNCLNIFVGSIWNETCGTATQGLVSTIDCLSAANNGSLYSGVSASSVSSDISYAGGNGLPYTGQTVTSTGITGLTATLTAGTMASGVGSLNYSITGTPSAVGTASFAINVGGQMCTLTRSVVLLGTIASINCAGATINGTLNSGTSASGVTAVIPYTSGNGGVHNGQTYPSVGVTGLTATLTPGTFANGSGTLTYTITGTAFYSGTALFGVNIGGASCTLSIPVVHSGSLNCGSVTNNGTLTSGQSAIGVTSVIPYTSTYSDSHNGQTVTSTGITGLTATLVAGSFVSGSGSLTYTITGTPSAAGTASFAINIAGQTCTITRTVSLLGTIASVNCSSATNNGTLTSGSAASGVTSELSYTTGNGGVHNGQSVTSTGVTGLTATLVAGSFATGAGTLSYSITGTPSAAGTASFAINIGGQTCTLSITVAVAGVYCTGTATTVVEVTSPYTSRVWMDRNLGATQVATNATDANAYGDLYQLGRGSDGHQCRNSTVTTTLSSTTTPGNSNFIQATPHWITGTTVSLWQGVNGVNNPCPNGFRLPTYSELYAERLAWRNAGLDGFTSFFKGTYAGMRIGHTNNLLNVGSQGHYTTSSGAASTNPASHSQQQITLVGDVGSYNPAYALSVRCIKDLAPSVTNINCNDGTANATIGTLTSGVVASNVASNVKIVGTASGFFPGQTVNSTGVTGLTATALSTSLEYSYILYTITGTPSGSGTASFAINIAGKTCTLTRTVN